MKTLMEDVEEDLFEGEFFEDPFRQVIWQALYLLDKFSDLIPNDGRCCSGTRDFLVDLFENPTNKFFNDGSWWGICDDEHATLNRVENNASKRYRRPTERSTA